MYYYGRDKRRRAKKRLKIALLSFVSFIVIGISYLLLVGLEDRNVVAVDPVENSLQARKILANSQQTPEEKIMPQNDTVIMPHDLDTTQLAIAKTEVSSEAAILKPKVQNKEQAPETNYHVIAKAYFYNEPNEETQRKSYINHWNNSYASIKPQEEKNGFIYVVFKNHLGQVTRGWLRKKDLRKVKAKYENVKE